MVRLPDLAHERLSPSNRHERLRRFRVNAEVVRETEAEDRLQTIEAMMVAAPGG
jgi:hypothetical protein